MYIYIYMYIYNVLLVCICACVHAHIYIYIYIYVFPFSISAHFRCSWQPGAPKSTIGVEPKHQLRFTLASATPSWDPRSSPRTSSFWRPWQPEAPESAQQTDVLCHCILQLPMKFAGFISIPHQEGEPLKHPEISLTPLNPKP